MTSTMRQSVSSQTKNVFRTTRSWMTWYPPFSKSVRLYLATLAVSPGPTIPSSSASSHGHIEMENTAKSIKEPMWRSVHSVMVTWSLKQETNTIFGSLARSLKEPDGRTRRCPRTLIAIGSFTHSS